MTPGEEQGLLTLAALLREGLLADPPAALTEDERLRIGRAVATRARPAGAVDAAAALDLPLSHLQGL